MSNSLQRLSRTIGYGFTDQSLLELALTHRSLGKVNYERMEFLGDSILNFVIAEALYQQFPQAKEGQLSRLRAGLVKGVTLAEIAREMDLGDYLKLGSGELKSGGFNRDSILADAVESIIGAIYLDSDLGTCKTRILTWFESRLASTSLDKNQKDPKTRLQEFLQARQQTLPEYELIDAVGQDHDQTFVVECKLPDHPSTRGEGSNRRMAEQQAAAAALAALGEKAKSV